MKWKRKWKWTMANGEMQHLVEELQALQNQFQKLLSRQRHQRELKSRLLKESPPTSENCLTSSRFSNLDSTLCRSLQGQVSFTPAPRRSDDVDDKGIGLLQLCMWGFKARQSPSAQASFSIQNRFDPLCSPTMLATLDDVFVTGDSIM